MAAFSAAHLTSADGSSAINAPASLTAAGNFFLKYTTGPRIHPLGVGAGLKELGSAAVVSREGHGHVGYLRVGLDHRAAEVVEQGEAAHHGEVPADVLLGLLLVGGAGVLVVTAVHDDLAAVDATGGVHVVGIGLGSHRGALEDPLQQRRDVAHRDRRGGDAGVVAERRLGDGRLGRR